MGHPKLYLLLIDGIMVGIFIKQELERKSEAAGRSGCAQLSVSRKKLNNPGLRKEKIICLI